MSLDKPAFSNPPLSCLYCNCKLSSEETYLNAAFSSIFSSLPAPLLTIWEESELESCHEDRPELLVLSTIGEIGLNGDCDAGRRCS